tara:strand:- start:1194 stop:1355 length:162 start_codon:yes stop_codon:yes gene_type:complete
MRGLFCSVANYSLLDRDRKPEQKEKNRNIAKRNICLYLGAIIADSDDLEKVRK